MDLPRQPTGGIFQDLASFAIFFDLREAAFEHYSPRRNKSYKIKKIDLRWYNTWDMHQGPDLLNQTPRGA